MSDPKMPDRHTPAANADILGDEAVNDGTMDADPAPSGNRERDGKRGEARPGKDINQAGFLKDQDRPGP